MSTSITSPRGSVRGVEGTVGRALESIRSLDSKRKRSLALQRVEEEESPCEDVGRTGKVVAYVTSLQAVRETYDNCKRVLQILNGHHVDFVQKDVFLHPDYARELSERLGIDSPTIPQVFINGELVGDSTTVNQLNEIGKLKELLQPFKVSDVGSTSVCGMCGGERFIPCLWCQGSKKGIRNTFSDLKCTVCNTNALQKCPACSM